MTDVQPRRAVDLAELRARIVPNVRHRFMDENYSFEEAVDDVEYLLPEVERLTAELERTRQHTAAMEELGNDLVDAILTVAPSTMYPKIVQDALSAWVVRLDAAQQDPATTVTEPIHGPAGEALWKPATSAKEAK